MCLLEQIIARFSSKQIKKNNTNGLGQKGIPNLLTIPIPQSKWKEKKRLESKEDKTPFNLPASSVANVVFDIMNSSKPKPRYYVTKATYLLGFFKRILSTSIMDKILSKM